MWPETARLEPPLLGQRLLAQEWFCLNHWFHPRLAHCLSRFHQCSRLAGRVHCVPSPESSFAIAASNCPASTGESSFASISINPSGKVPVLRASIRAEASFYMSNPPKLLRLSAAIADALNPLLKPRLDCMFDDELKLTELILFIATLTLAFQGSAISQK